MSKFFLEKNVISSKKRNFLDVDKDPKIIEVPSIFWLDEVKKRDFETSANKDFIKTFDDEKNFICHLKSGNRWKFICLLTAKCDILSKKPAKDFTIFDFHKMFGDGKLINVFDVLSQESVEMRIESFIKLYEKKESCKILELLSPDVSKDM